MARRGKVRIGFTTGSAAAAAAKAGLLYLLHASLPHRVDIPCPRGRSRLIIPVITPENPVAVHDVDPTRSETIAGVFKQAGDDPDVTNHALIMAHVRLEPAETIEIELVGGRGVGRVTRPGLPVVVGEAAINPGPQRQIARTLREILERAGITGRVTVTIEVPQGKRLAAKTFNPRLGIVGGISILGTRGTVQPFSHAAWRETIVQCLGMAKAENRMAVALSTGGRGRQCLRAVFPDHACMAFVQAGDHLGFALRRAAKMGFSPIIWGGFWGKLVKMAQGRPQTHARLFTANLPALAEIALEHGVDRDAATAMARANTARHALEILNQCPHASAVIATILRQALAHCQTWAGPGPKLELILFDYDGREIMRLRAC